MNGTTETPLEEAVPGNPGEGSAATEAPETDPIDGLGSVMLTIDQALSLAAVLAQRNATKAQIEATAALTVSANGQVAAAGALNAQTAAFNARRSLARDILCGCFTSSVLKKDPAGSVDLALAVADHLVHKTPATPNGDG